MTDSAPLEAVAPAATRRDPWIPCILAWLIPGLGHLALGKRTRAGVFFACVVLAFSLGILSDGAATLIDRQQPLTYLATFDNLALGPLDLVARYRTYGRLAYRLPADESDPLHQELTRRLRTRIESVTYEYGSTFLLVAGLMNILLIMDAYDIASGRKD